MITLLLPTIIKFVKMFPTYGAWSKNIWAVAVKLAVPNLPWWLTNPLWSRPPLLGCAYSSGSSTAGRTLFFGSLEVAVLFQGILNLGEEESVTLGNVWWGRLPYLWNVHVGQKLLHTLGSACQCLVMMNLPCTRLPFFFIYGKLHQGDLSTSK